MKRLKHILGAFLVALPFVAFAVLCFKLGGWHCFGFVFGLTTGIIVILAAGVALLTAEARDAKP